MVYTLSQSVNYKSTKCNRTKFLSAKIYYPSVQRCKVQRYIINQYIHSATGQRNKLDTNDFLQNIVRVGSTYAGIVEVLDEMCRMFSRRLS